MTSDVILNKTETIGRCIQGIREEYSENAENLKDYTKQDSIILNLQRACEACIDLAMRVVSEKKFGIPQNSRDAFTFLQEHNVIDDQISRELKAQHLNNFTDFAEHIRLCMESI